MRLGLSPTRKESTDYSPCRVTVCVLVHIPDRLGYYAHRFEVLKLCLQSIFQHTHSAYDLLVFDNGSCPEVIDYLRLLRDQGAIQYLILSAHNIGIYGALKIMFQAAPGEVIAYSQDDVFFYAGWLEEHLKILDTFPRVGMVSGVAVREQFRYGNKYLQTYLSEFSEVSVKEGRFIPDDWEVDFFVSTGRYPYKALEETRNYEDIMLEYKGIKVYSTAVHFQYVAFKDVILQGLSKYWDARLMEGPDVEIDEKIDSMGYARMATLQRYVRHIGNVVTFDFKEEISALGLNDELSIWKPPKPVLLRLVQPRIIRIILNRFSNWLYCLLRYRQVK
jgi:glycosyltransferase involved in cell wall biosynthesis